MNRIISIRELALLGLLIILAAYYFVVQGPVASETLNLANQRADLQSEIDIASAKAMQVNKMQSELDIIYEKAGGDPQSLATYSNNKVLLQELNVYMDMADEFDISFGDETITDSVMRREITINYKTQSKEAAEYIAQLIEDSRNTYLITGFNTSCDEQNTQWSSTLSLVNYEYVTRKQEAELNAGKNPGSSNAKTADDQTSVLESLAGEVSK